MLLLLTTLIGCAGPFEDTAALEAADKGIGVIILPCASLLTAEVDEQTAAELAELAESATDCSVAAAK